MKKKYISYHLAAEELVIEDTDIKWEAEDFGSEEISEEEQARLLEEYEAEIQEREKRKSQIVPLEEKVSVVEAMWTFFVQRPSNPRKWIRQFELNNIDKWINISFAAAKTGDEERSTGGWKETAIDSKEYRGK